MRHLITASTLAAVCCLSLTACTGSDDRSTPQPSPRSTLRLGQSADTAGVGGRGTARITPDTVVYADSTNFGTPEHGLFAVVNYQSRNRTKSRVTTTAEQGGLRWKAADGHTVTARNSKAAEKVAPIGFSEGGPVFTRPTIHQDVAVFDISATERGGTLIYVDGDGTVFRWKIPASNSGIAVPALKFALN
ncbi:MULTISPECIES: hypothetical protein [unclassified Streptomyces]|uniref:hypothetical protein n=1 Tax=unclassified Streptomyces TaxID=2593676 RepID=UPI002E33F8A4|nr:hypothetical protein [Streptomyces sp. NBC_01280]WSE13123.1 hypothetical protein OG518_07275 [Streptomyces sp. NBC_01397]